MLNYNLDVEKGSLWLRTTPTELALKQPFYCPEAGIFYAREQFNTVRDFKDSWIIFHTIEGCGIIEQSGVNVRLLPGETLLMNCRSPQSYYTDPSAGLWNHYWIHVGGQGMSGLEALLIPEGKIAPVRMSDEIRGVFDQVLRNMESVSSETILSLSLLLHELLTRMILKPEEVTGETHKAIMKSAAYIRQHFNEPIGIRDLLPIANMSRAYYMRMFRRYIGTTPYNYLLSLRITKAREYLEVTDYPIHEIALRTGFSDDPSFSSRFSAMVGISPLKYRREAITRNQKP